MKKKTEEISEPTNGGKETIACSEPYEIEVVIEGVADILLHRWNCESVEAKQKAAKGSKAKKQDDLESYVYRMENGHLAVPGEYLRQSILNAAKFRQDPRSPRKSAQDLYKAGVQSLTTLSDFGFKDWNYVHKCRVTVQRNGITRSRPAIKAGWNLKFRFLICTPEYITPHDLIETLTNAGRLIGMADSRPTYGRYVVKSWKVLTALENAA